MWKFVKSGAIGLFVVVAISIVACRPSNPSGAGNLGTSGATEPSKPTGNEYLGKWTAPMKLESGTVYPCYLTITKNGSSFVVEAVDADNYDNPTGICRPFVGLYTLTPEGNLTGGNQYSPISFSYDKATDRVMNSHNGIRYLTKR